MYPGLIKALRANKNDEVRVVQQALDECRKEISNKDMDVKAAAVLKLVYVSSPTHDQSEEIVDNRLSFALLSWKC